MSASENPPALKVGQTVFALNIGNNARYREQSLSPVIVRSVGRKYFYCSPSDCPDGRTCYSLDTYLERGDQFTPTSKIYLTRDEWDWEKESAQICKRIGAAFEYGHNRPGLSIDNLRQIDALLKARAEHSEGKA